MSANNFQVRRLLRMRSRYDTSKIPILPPLTEFQAAEATASLVPFALCEQEMSESDLETLRQIAEDKSAATGRLRRIPKEIPVAEPVSCVSRLSS